MLRGQEVGMKRGLKKLLRSGWEPLIGRMPEVEFTGLGLVGGEIERKWYRELNRSLWVLPSGKD